LKALIDKGIVKARNFVNHKNKHKFKAGLEQLEEEINRVEKKTFG